MRFSGPSVVSTLALLLAIAGVQGCPTLKASGRKTVVGGRTSFYKLRVATGSTAIVDATVTVRNTRKPDTRQDDSPTRPRHSPPLSPLYPHPLIDHPARRRGPRVLLHLGQARRPRAARLRADLGQRVSGGPQALHFPRQGGRGCLCPGRPRLRGERQRRRVRRGRGHRHHDG